MNRQHWRWDQKNLDEHWKNHRSEFFGYTQAQYAGLGTTFLGQKVGSAFEGGRVYGYTYEDSAGNRIHARFLDADGWDNVGPLYAVGNLENHQVVTLFVAGQGLLDAAWNYYCNRAKRDLGFLPEECIWR